MTKIHGFGHLPTQLAVLTAELVVEVAGLTSAQGSWRFANPPRFSQKRKELFWIHLVWFIIQQSHYSRLKKLWGLLQKLCIDALIIHLSGTFSMVSNPRNPRIFESGLLALSAFRRPWAWISCRSTFQHLLSVFSILSCEPQPAILMYLSWKIQRRRVSEGDNTWQQQWRVFHFKHQQPRWGSNTIRHSPGSGASWHGHIEFHLFKCSAVGKLLSFDALSWCLQGLRIVPDHGTGNCSQISELGVELLKVSVDFFQWPTGHKSKKGKNWKHRIF